MSTDGSSTMSYRRALLRLAPLGLTPLGLLGGCGFRPLYGSGDGSASSPRAMAELAKVRVALIPERNGQLLRRALEQRLRRPAEVPAAYELRCGLAFGQDIQGFRRDGIPSRVRTTATANWFLFSIGATPASIANGAERSFDAYNIPENQFFAADSSREAMERRLVDLLADDIVRRLAIVLTTRTAPGATGS